MARTRLVLQPKVLVGLRLTGSPLSDPWSSKGLCHILTSEPATGVLQRVGFEPSVAPPLADAWERRGAVTSEAAAAFGLPEGVPVSVGWSDAVAAMLAVGAFEVPSAFVLSGTSSIVGITSDRALSAHPSLLELPAACAPLAVHYGPTESSGASIEWAARLLRCSPAEVLALAASVETGGAPVFVPYLSGERAPVWRTDVRAVVLGLGSRHGPPELARAVVDGVCLSEADVLAVAEEHTGSAPASVAVGGRGAGQAPWLEARLSALSRPLDLLDEPDASALGAAMLGAAAALGTLDAARPLRGICGGTRGGGDLAGRRAANPCPHAVRHPHRPVPAGGGICSAGEPIRLGGRSDDFFVRPKGGRPNHRTKPTEVDNLGPEMQLTPPADAEPGGQRRGPRADPLGRVRRPR